MRRHSYKPVHGGMRCGHQFILFAVDPPLATHLSEPLPRSTKRRRQAGGAARRGPGAAGCKSMYPVRAAQRARPPSCQPVEHAMPAMPTTRAGYLSLRSPLPAERHDLSLLFPFSIRKSSLLFSLSSFFFFPFRFFCARREQKLCIPALFPS